MRRQINHLQNNPEMLMTDHEYIVLMFKRYCSNDSLGHDQEARGFLVISFMGPTLKLGELLNKFSGRKWPLQQCLDTKKGVLCLKACLVSLPIIQLDQ